MHKKTFDQQITELIHTSYSEKFAASYHSDVLIAGGGPSGLTAAYLLTQWGKDVTVLEQRLAPGGGIWGGGMGMNEVVIQEDVCDLLDTWSVRYTKSEHGFAHADAVELASSMIYQAVHSGARILNMLAAEDVCIINDRVQGLVVNRPNVIGTLPVDPVTLTSQAVLDATGHEAVVCNALLRQKELPPESANPTMKEGGMDAANGEKFVVENTQEVFPGLWVSGMGVCAVFGGPRMGPIFGGMLASGRRVAQLIYERLH